MPQIQVPNILNDKWSNLQLPGEIFPPIPYIPSPRAIVAAFAPPSPDYLWFWLSTNVLNNIPLINDLKGFIDNVLPTSPETIRDFAIESGKIGKARLREAIF